MNRREMLNTGAIGLAGMIAAPSVAVADLVDSLDEKIAYPPNVLPALTDAIHALVRVQGYAADAATAGDNSLAHVLKTSVVTAQLVQPCANLVAMQSGFARAIKWPVRDAIIICRDACWRHLHHRLVAECYDACRRAEQACLQL